MEANDTDKEMEPERTYLPKIEDFDRRYRKPSDNKTVLENCSALARRKCRKLTCKRVLFSNFPFLRSFRSYRPFQDLPGDIVSGLTVGIMTIPQGNKTKNQIYSLH